MTDHRARDDGPIQKLPRIDNAAIAKLTNEIIELYDLAAIDSLKNKYENDLSQSGRMKYTDYRRHVAVNVRRALAVGLDLQPKRKILDIGTGFGYFPLVARHLGHECVALDCYTKGLYEDATRHLKVHSIDYMIQPHQPLPNLGRFDLITAFAVAFCQNSSTKILWQFSEWDFFLKDILDSNLNKGGILWLHLNALYNGERLTEELSALFVGFGADLNGSHALFYKE